jgi:segregation and condensation protein A
MQINTALAVTDSTDPWPAPQPPAAEEVMYVDVGGYEGPLDLLLELARKQKVDLANISVLALAEQYLAFIETIRKQRIEIAADYLVMAAWLAYLKSRLMVPQDDDDEAPSGDEMAALLQFRLQRLEAMRDAARRLINGSRLGRDVFARGMPEAIVVTRHRQWDATYYDLLRAYASGRERTVPTDYVPKKRNVWSLHDAQEVMTRLLGSAVDWTPLGAFLADYLGDSEERVTVIASSFSASLEMVRRGELELRQGRVFGPILLRKRDQKLDQN